MYKKFIQNTIGFLARMMLRRYHPLIIGVTGSVGKTSTKEAIYTVLRQQFRADRNFANLNTEIGMPLTIIRGQNAQRNIALWLMNYLRAFWLLVFKSRNYPEVLVLEMSEDAPGMIKYLVNLAQPQIGVVTVIGDPPVHLEYYANVKELTDEIGCLPQSLPVDGTVVLNADQPAVLDFKNRTTARVITYGFSEQADVRISEYKILPAENLADSGISFRLESGGSFVPVKIPGVLGEGQAYALAAAAAVGLSLDMNLVEISEAMPAYRSVDGRVKLSPGIKGSWILDDSYNACPDSVRAAFNLMKDIPAGRKIAFLGDMKELGENMRSAHEEIGRKAAAEVDILVAVGEGMCLAAAAAQRANSKLQTFCLTNSAEAADLAQKIIQKGDLVLVKGSHAMEMEKVAEVLKNSVSGS